MLRGSAHDKYTQSSELNLQCVYVCMCVCMYVCICICESVLVVAVVFKMLFIYLMCMSVLPASTEEERQTLSVSTIA